MVKTPMVCLLMPMPLLRPLPLHSLPRDGRLPLEALEEHGTVLLVLLPERNQGRLLQDREYRRDDWRQVFGRPIVPLVRSQIPEKRRQTLG
ncbi:hypothetical protein EV126DRAFT_196572 [Verticillium dahliae]|nr:hypothetical protein EV126DRAFT_196572 [Verticillium dahliae]